MSWCVASQWGSSVGQTDHNWAAERSEHCAPWGAQVDVPRGEKGWSALLPPPKALGLMAAVWERLRHDYFGIAEKDDFPVTGGPSTKQCCCHAAWGLRHIGGGSEK